MDKPNPTFAKIPILDIGKFEQWKFRIQQYLQNEHYALWEVIEFGDSYKAPLEETGKGTTSESSAKKNGRTVIITTEDMQKRRNHVKARTTLLLALPDEHQLRFNKYETAQELWEAILKTFGGNEATKRTKKNQLKKQYGNFKDEGSKTLEQTFNRLQAIVGHLEFMNVEIEQDDLNQKFLTSLAPEWLMYTIVWRNRDDLDTMSPDDVSGKGEVHTASVSTASTQVFTASTDVAAASLSHDIVCAYIASQLNGSQIKYEDITQIDEDDIEEIDIKWNMALLSMRADKFWKKTGKKITIQGSDVAGFDKSKEEEQAPKALMAIDGIGWDWSYMANEEENHALVADDEAPTKLALMAKSRSSLENEVYDDSYFSKSCRKNTENLNTKISELNEKLSDCETDIYHYKRGLSQIEARLVEFKEQEIKFCEKIRGLERDVEVRNNKIEYLMNELEQVKKEKEGLDYKLTGFESALKDLDNLLGSQRSDKNKEGLGYNAVPPLLHKPTPSIDSLKSNTSDLQSSNFFVFEHEESSSSIMSKPMIKFVKAADSPRVIKTNNIENARKSTVKYAEMYMNTSKSPKVRGNQRKTMPKNNFAHKNVSPRAVLLKTGRTPIADSGCSRHMTGNISYLSEYEPYDGGYVSFGQGGGKITGKGIIKTSKLKFENVYFVKELKYNLFSVSQIYDNKNSVLFTDSECIVLGKDFKLKDDTNVLLRTPRQHNMYSIDLNNIVPYKNMTCLVAKASVDESMLWHKRLGHLNFKTMNKLVRNNIVKGLPSKCFENDQTCVGCLKGKQHKASCKTKLVNSVSKPLHTLHMDLFGPTSAEAVNTACYVQNKVLVNKSQNKTPYELFNSRTPAIGFLRPFGCHVMILNTLDHLGKFDAKGDEGYFIRYSMSSKAFRVFNKRTKKVEENLHVDFLENKLIEKGAGPNWLFDIDTLTNSMNYVPVVVAGTSSTNTSGTKDVANQAVKKDVSSLRYIALPNWFHEAHMDTRNYDAPDGCNADVTESSGISKPIASSKVPLADLVEPVVSITGEFEILTVSSPVPTVCLDNSPKSSSGPRLITKGDFSQQETPSLGNALTLSNRFEDTIGVEADLSNMESNIQVSPTPTFRIHKDHPKSQIIGPVDTPIQTRHKSKEMVEHSFIATIHQKTNPDLLQFCLFSCFLSQEESKKIFNTLKDPSWVEAIQEELLQFKIQNMDVKSAFLYDTIDEKVYVMQPPGFQDPEFPDRVYKVEKEMYGLYQLCREFEALMHDKFQMSAMGELTFFLDVRSASTPMDKENPWGKDRPGKDVKLYLYRSMIRSLMYLTASRPNIMFAICACARHQVTPKECHLHAVKRIFRYLKDNDYGGATQHRKSTTGGCQFLRRRLISWQCKKQTIVATSTNKAEYVAAASGCGQVLWIQNQMLDYGNFIMAKLAFCDYHNTVAILEKTEHNINFHQIVDFLKASHIRYALTISPTVYVSHIRQFWSTARIEQRIKGQRFSLLWMGEGSIIPTKPHHTPSPQEQHSPRHDPLSPSHPTTTTEPIPQISTETPTLRQYSRRATRIAQSKALSPAADEPASLIWEWLEAFCSAEVREETYIAFGRENTYQSLLGDDRQGEAFYTVSSLDAGHDRENINKTSALPHESSPRVTSLDADEGSMQQKLQKLMELCTSLQRQQTQMAAKIKDQDLEISGLKARVKFLEDKDKGSAEPTQEDALIKGGIMEIGEDVGANKSTKIWSNNTDEMVNVLSSMEAANILTSGVAAVSVSPVAGVSTVGVPTVSGLFPTASTIFTTASVIDAQVAREMEEEFARENQRVSEQLARDSEIARLHAEEELKMTIKGLDRSNEVIAKHLQEYEQAAADLSVGEKIELINELVKYQDHHAKILKYQAQQSKSLSKKEQREFYMSVLRSHAGWKTKHFRGMTLEEIKEKFIPVWKQFEDFMPMSSKEEAERVKRKCLKLDQGSSKRMKTSEDVSEEDLKGMMRLVPLEEVYVEALQLWTLVKETFSIRQATKDKEKELWVEPKRLFELDFEDQLWTHNQAFIHDPLDWKLYDTCGVHHVSTKDQEIFMLVERDYPLRRGLSTMMICNKLQVENIHRWLMI
uniref:Ribonuclease H-like domain-containing protein n=1 Tax=Tanacetum cinerariifolium TaxID=118510 RepID=A0A6L2K4W8_TANCI|nr:ribonuclease H-like domain-containing protein [Tanacetum cinerariifolium]